MTPAEMREVAGLAHEEVRSDDDAVSLAGRLDRFSIAAEICERLDEQTRLLSRIAAKLEAGGAK